MRRTHVLSAPVVILLVIRLFVLLAMRNTSSMAQFVSQRRERSMKMDTGEIIVTVIIVAIGILTYWVINSNDN
jgi:membrane protein insertase Oxa1/YidC/SpoIIIJ